MCTFSLSENRINDKVVSRETKSDKVCLVTNYRSLSEGLQDQWSYGDLRIRNHLVDLVKESDCSLYIIDTKVKDMNIWPAPLFKAKDAKLKVWLFLVSRVADVSLLEPLPQNAKFLDGKHLSVEDLVSFMRKQFDPELGKRMAKVHYLESLRAFLVRMENGRAYVLPVSELLEADSSGIAKWSLARDHSYFKVTQESGNWFEIPGDDVLHHCEPEYEYYKGGQVVDRNSGHRIGEKVRQLRKTRGYSIQELAQRAGMKRPNLSRLEHGKHQPSLETIEGIAAALGLPVVDIVARHPSH